MGGAAWLRSLEPDLGHLGPFQGLASANPGVR
jgi:hypothetical protein